MAHRQGGMCDKSEIFVALREEHKQLIGQILASKIEFLDKASKKEANTSSALTNFLAFSSDRYCIACGQSFHIFNKDVQCCVCPKSFCMTCMRKFSDKEILDIIDSPTPVAYSCEKCYDILECQKDKERRRKFRALKEQSGLTEIYEEVSRTKEQIKQLLPQYDYLATSITEIKISGTTERDDTSFGLSYPQAKLKEKKLLVLVKELEEGTKKFDTIVTEKEIEKRILANIKSSFTLCLQSTLVLFQEIQKKVAKVELKSVAHIYVFMRRLELETRANTNFASRFKKMLDEVSEHVLRETNQICVVQAQSDWESYKTRLDNRIKVCQRELVTSPMKALLPPRDNKSHKESVETTSPPLLIRKITSLVSDNHKRFLTRGIHAPMTAKVLSFILQKLENRYDDGLKFN